MKYGVYGTSTAHDNVFGCGVIQYMYNMSRVTINLAFIASSFRVTEENLVFETVQSGPYSSFECFLCS